MKTLKDTKNNFNTIFEYENQLQAAIVQAMQDNFFEYKDLLYHIYNNPKNSAHGATLRTIGLKKGMPDFCLAVSTEKHGALYIELKTKNGRTSPDQIKRHQQLIDAGNNVITCRSVGEAMEAIEAHLAEKKIKE